MQEQAEQSGLPDLTEDIAKALRYWCEYASKLPHSELEGNWGHYCMGKTFLRTWLNTQIEFAHDFFRQDKENAKWANS